MAVRGSVHNLPASIIPPTLSTTVGSPSSPRSRSFHGCEHQLEHLLLSKAYGEAKGTPLLRFTLLVQLHSNNSFYTIRCEVQYNRTVRQIVVHGECCPEPRTVLWSWTGIRCHLWRHNRIGRCDGCNVHRLGYSRITPYPSIPCNITSFSPYLTSIAVSSASSGLIWVVIDAWTGGRHEVTCPPEACVQAFSSSVSKLKLIQLAWTAER